MKQIDGLDFLRKGGTFNIECYDEKGNLKWTDESKNVVLRTGGKQHALDVLFASGTQVTTWHLGVSNDATALDQDYSLAGEVGTRQATTFTRTDETVDSDQESFTGITDTVRKAFVVSAASGGSVFAISDLSTARVLTSGDTLKVTYSISAA